MRSFYTAALCLALIHSSSARVPHSFRDLIDRDPKPEPELQPHNGFMHWISNLFKRVAQTSSTISTTSSTGGTCYEDAYYDFVGDEPNFCRQFIRTPNVTMTVDYTPTTTSTVFTTYVSTAEDLTRFTPLSTLTVTETPNASQAKREVDPELEPRRLQQADIDDVFQMFRRQNAANSTLDNAAAMSTSFSSACSCRDYPGSTVTATYTDAAVTTTLRGFTRTTTTSTRTTVAAVRVVSTTTLTEVPSSSKTSSSDTMTSQTSGSGSSPTTTTSQGEPTPTSPAFTCPDDNNTTVSQMVGNERFDYLVLCDTVLMDADFYAGPLSYVSFGQCASACSIANANFSQVVCEGVSYYATGTNSGTCFLKSGSQLRTAADGVDSAILQRVLMGVSPNQTAGTTTESLPFANPTMTQSPEQMSSIMQSILSNSSNTMPIVTPGPIVQSGMLVNAPGAMYSTFVTGGSTFSTGSAYSFSTQYSDGSWYYTYFSTYNVAWASSTIIYANSENGYQAENSTTDQVQEVSGDNGEYSIITNSTTHKYGGGWDNATSVLSNVTYNAQNSQIASTATTYTANSFTGGAASGGPTALPGTDLSGNSAGGSAGGGSGGPGSGSPATTTSTFSTETVIINSGGTNGATSTAASGGATPTPQPSATTIVNSFNSVGSTGFVLSGGGTVGATSTAASGGPSPSLSEVTVIVNSTEISGETSAAGSGGPSGSPSPISSIVNSAGTSGVIQASGSGGPNSTEGATSTEASGGPSSSPSGSFSAPSGPRSPWSTTSSTLGTAPPGTGSVPTATETGAGSTPVFNSTGGFYTGPSPSSPSSTGGSFSAPSGPRSPYSTTSSTLGTAPTSPSGPLPTGYTSVNSTSSPGTSAPGTAPSPYSSGTAPLSTGPPLSTGTAPSSSSTTDTFGANTDTRIGGSLSRTPTPSGTMPTGTGPLSTGPSSYPPGNSTLSPGTSPPGTQPSGTGSTRTRTRTRTRPMQTTGTSPPLSTGTTLMPSNTCSNMTMGTTTIFSTTTVYGCFDICPPAGTGGYGYGPPHGFGPPGGWPTGGVRQAADAGVR